MNKKILLSTILATSAVVGTAQNAFANIEIGYKPNHGTSGYYMTLDNHGYGAKSYTGKELAQAIIQRVKAGENVVIDKESLENIQTSFKESRNAGMGHASATIKEFLRTMKFSLTEKEFNPILGKVLPSNPPPLRKQSSVSKELAQHWHKSMSLQKSTRERFEKKVMETLSDDTKAKLTAFKDKSKALNEQMKTDSGNPELQRQRFELDKQWDESLAQELQKVKDNTELFAAIRSAAETQEELKQGLKALEALKNDAKTDIEKQYFARRLKAIQEESLEMYLADEKTTEHKNLSPVQKSDTHTAAGIAATSSVNSNVLTNRMSSFAGAGVASGDQEVVQTYGTWVKGHFGTGAQKAFKAEAGYKFSQKGITIGADTGDDEYVVGLAVSYFKNDVTSKSGLSIKDKIDTGMLSAYALFAVTPEVFVSGQLTYGMSTIKKSRNTGDLANNKATAKTKGNNFGGRAEVGYIYALNSTTELVPAVGVAYNQVEVKGYTEKGDGLNRAVGKMTNTRTSGLAGIILKHMADTGSMKIVPELHANVDYAFSGKNSATKYTLANFIDRTTPSEKISKLYLNLGTSVKFVASDMFDVTAGYDMGLSKKFMSHTGSLKLRVNF